jgi:hypothetical protein
VEYPELPGGAPSLFDFATCLFEMGGVVKIRAKSVYRRTVEIFTFCMVLQ